MPNWSSRVATCVAVTTLVDLVPPAAVGDLTATGSDALDASILPGRPAAMMTTSAAAASYEIRYSTSPIDAGNWASATVVPNWLAPQAAGSAETLHRPGRAARDSVLFRRQGDRRSGNVSTLSNVAAAHDRAAARHARGHHRDHRREGRRRDDELPADAVHGLQAGRRGRQRGRPARRPDPADADRCEGPLGRRHRPPRAWCR